MERPRRLAETIKSGRGAVATFIKGESPGAGLAQTALGRRARRRDGRGPAAGAGAADAVARRRRELAAAVAVAPRVFNTFPGPAGLAAVRRLGCRVVRRGHARAAARARVLRVVAVAAVASRGRVARRRSSVAGVRGSDAVHGVAGESSGGRVAAGLAEAVRLVSIGLTTAVRLVAGRALAVAREPAAAAGREPAVLRQRHARAAARARRVGRAVRGVVGRGVAADRTPPVAGGAVAGRVVVAVPGTRGGETSGA